MWGQVTRYLHMLKDSGIIPTRVGTRKALDFAGVNYEDHPHACGDKVYDDSLSYYETGSSPRVWGQDAIYFSGSHSDRIIPTRVGTSCLYDAFYIRSEDHPHACGDKLE